MGFWENFKISLFPGNPEVRFPRTIKNKFSIKIVADKNLGKVTTFGYQTLFDLADL